MRADYQRRSCLDDEDVCLLHPYAMSCAAMSFSRAVIGIRVMKTSRWHVVAPVGLCDSGDCD
jgi:hypothetical protein